MRANDLMTVRVITVAPATRVRDAVGLMLERHVSGLPVTSEAGELVGIVTEGDLLVKAAEPRRHPPAPEWFARVRWLERWAGRSRKTAGRTVGEVMTQNVITAEEDTPVHALAARMLRHRVNRLPVVRGRQLVGIVTRADILKVFLRSDEALAGEARRIVDLFLLSDEEIQVEVRGGVIALRGCVRGPRRQALLDRLGRIEGIVALDDAGLTRELAESPGARG